MALTHTATRSGLAALTVFLLAASQHLAALPKTITPPAKPAATAAAHASKTASAAHTASPANHSNPGAANGGHPATTGHPTATTGHATGTLGTSGHTLGTSGHTLGTSGHTLGTSGHTLGTAGGASRTFKSPNGGEARFGSHGEVRSAHVNGMNITHGPGGSREVVRDRGGVRVVSHAGGRGYVEHGYTVGHDRFEHRTYVYRGAHYDRFYRPYFYHGVGIDVYLPRFYYGPAFYGWAYAPWAAPVYYSWAFTASPWYAYYGGYFAPYPVYASPSLWLTDYLVASSLQQGYQAQMDAAQAANAPVDSAAPLTPEVKQAIADEIRRQIALENVERQGVSQNAAPDAASSGIERMLGDNTPHVFVAGNSLMLNSNAGECGVTEGDVLQLANTPQPNDTSATLVVLSSKGSDCSKGATVSVAFNDLQEMQNHMRETIDQGMGELRSRQGQAGLPTEPAPAMAAPIQPAFATQAPPPDANASAEVNQQSQEAVTAEQDLVAQSLAGPGNGGRFGLLGQ